MVGGCTAVSRFALAAPRASYQHDETARDGQPRAWGAARLDARVAFSAFDMMNARSRTARRTPTLAPNSPPARHPSPSCVDWCIRVSAVQTPRCSCPRKSSVGARSSDAVNCLDCARPAGTMRKETPRLCNRGASTAVLIPGRTAALSGKTIPTPASALNLSPGQAPPSPSVAGGLRPGVFPNPPRTRQVLLRPSGEGRHAHR